jgi:hypothetical protein
MFRVDPVADGAGRGLSNNLGESSCEGVGPLIGIPRDLPSFGMAVATTLPVLTANRGLGGKGAGPLGEDSIPPVASRGGRSLTRGEVGDLVVKEGAKIERGLPLVDRGEGGLRWESVPRTDGMRRTSLTICA